MDNIKEVREALDKLEQLPPELEARIKKIMKREGILTRLDGEHEFKRLAAELFGSDDTEKLNKVVINYLQEKYTEIKNRMHQAVLNRENYLEGLLELLENPEVSDERKLQTDTFGGFSNEVTYRFGLENELLDYLKINPQAKSKVLRKIRSWRSDKYPSLVQSSSYRIIATNFTEMIKRPSRRLKYIKHNAPLFLKCVQEGEGRAREYALFALGRLLQYWHKTKMKKGEKITEEEAKPYRVLIDIAKEEGVFTDRCKSFLSSTVQQFGPINFYKEF